MQDHTWIIGRIENGFCTHELGDIFQEKDIVIMQYTGLKDSNGKEIYEGDITDEGLVIFHNEYLGFFVKNDYEEEQLRPLYDFAFLEIIGNVYETPQLLNP